VYSTPKCPATELCTASILVLRIGSIDGCVATGFPLLRLELGLTVGGPILSPDMKTAASLSVFATLSIGLWSQSLEKKISYYAVLPFDVFVFEVKLVQCKLPTPHLF
jgi:hypothetical protein